MHEDPLLLFQELLFSDCHIGWDADNTVLLGSKPQCIWNPPSCVHSTLHNS